MRNNKKYCYCMFKICNNLFSEVLKMISLCITVCKKALIPN